MKNKGIVTIIKYCLKLDIKAYDIYQNLSENSLNKELKQFWKKMSDEERQHITFWKTTLDLANTGGIPQLFEQPDTVINELKAIDKKVIKLKETLKKNKHVSYEFLVAFRLEFFILHPAFETLFRFMNFVDKKQYNPEDDYSAHIGKFINALDRFGAGSLELELLGENLKKLWERNISLAAQNSLDELTKILNRRGFLNVIKPLLFHCQRHSNNIGIAMIDIDYFKLVNDKYGHLEGDKILKIVAETLKNSLRTSDIVGRYGGEEFILFFPDITKESLGLIGEKLRKNIIDKTKDYIPVTVSVGLVSGKLDINIQDTFMELLKTADKNLYIAKETGRNKVVI